MGEDGSAGAAGPRRYNRPRRYPVPTPATTQPDAPAEVTRQNPTLAAAAQDHEQRFGPPADTPTAPLPRAHPADAYPPTTEPAHPRTVSRRAVLVGIAILAVLAVVGLVIGLSGGNDPTPEAGPAGPTPSTPASSVAARADSPTAVCARLGAITPFTSFVSSPRPAGRMPLTYVEPQGGTRVAICVGAFRPGAGVGRGRVAYLAEYQQLPATRYAAQLTTLGWLPEPNLPATTYRNNLTTTVTLVQQGSTLVTVVGTGR